MDALLQGIIYGITVSFLIGPIFFGLADLTISKGWRSGLAYVFGVIISDVVLIYFVEKLLHLFPFDAAMQAKVGIVGGIILVVFGLATLLSKASVKAADISSVKTLAGAFLKGVTINVFNPFVTLWWISMYTSYAITCTTFSDKFLFYFGILMMVFFFDLLKMRFAYFLKQKLTTQNLSYLKKVVGVCLVVFGVVMIVKVL